MLKINIQDKECMDSTHGQWIFYSKRINEAEVRQQKLNETKLKQAKHQRVGTNQKVKQAHTRGKRKNMSEES